MDDVAAASSDTAAFDALCERYASLLTTHEGLREFAQAIRSLALEEAAKVADEDK